jgi:hypothetical protein
VRKSSVSEGNAGDWTASAGTNADDSEWIVLPQDEFTYLGSHPHTFIFGCTDSDANNFNADATLDDGSCTYGVTGCTDSFANNYNPNAISDDGSCIHDLFFSEYAEGSSNNKYLEIYNPTEAAVSLALYAYPRVSN